MAGVELDADIGRIEAELSILFRRARAFARRAAAEVDPELPPAAYLMLARLVDEGPKKATELVEAFGIDKAAISRQVGQLERLKLIERTPVPGDRRAHMLAATEDGRTRCLEARDRTRANLRQRIAKWPASDVRALGELLERLNQINFDD